MSKNKYCPNCWNGLSADEINLRYCQNCSLNWKEPANDALQNAIEDKYIKNAMYIASTL
ncbi:MAG TPA: hypothetical protein VK050_06415 [Flavobacteriaceae bacterium]|nr:hypothetical protein [Flavobacteriaceae bacterium]